MLEVHSGNFSKGCSSYCKSAAVFLLPLFHPCAARQEQFRSSECQPVSLLVLLGAAPKDAEKCFGSQFLQSYPNNILQHFLLDAQLYESVISHMGAKETKDLERERISWPQHTNATVIFLEVAGTDFHSSCSNQNLMQTQRSHAGFIT